MDFFFRQSVGKDTPRVDRLKWGGHFGGEASRQETLKLQARRTVSGSVNVLPMLEQERYGTATNCLM